ncbi:hypothetical protein KSF78_0007410, partial [Schistosoma japonicum]
CCTIVVKHCKKTFKAYPSGINVYIDVKNIRLLPEYEDVEHLSSDNGIVMDSSRKSNMQHWRKPLETIIKTACRFKPKRTFLFLKIFIHTSQHHCECQKKPMGLVLQRNLHEHSLIGTMRKYPLPKQYYLTMHPYLDRHTTARRHICQSNTVTSRLCPANYPSGYIFYDRSINGQCTQNLQIELNNAEIVTHVL